MLSFIGRSLVQKVVTLIFVAVISFLIIHLAPGEPSQIDPLNPKFTPEIVERMRKEFHLDEPLHIQFYLFYRDLFTGQIVSWKDQRPVLGKIWERFLNSLPLFNSRWPPGNHQCRPLFNSRWLRDNQILTPCSGAPRQIRRLHR